MRTLEARIAPLLRMRELKLLLWAEGYRGRELIEKGAGQLDEAEDDVTLELWESEEFRVYLATEPGRLF